MTDRAYINTRDVITRVYRRYQNEVAEKRQSVPQHSDEEIARVAGWVAGVSFAEWFALVDEHDRYREAWARSARSALINRREDFKIDVWRAGTYRDALEGLMQAPDGIYTGTQLRKIAAAALTDSTEEERPPLSLDAFLAVKERDV